MDNGKNASNTAFITPEFRATFANAFEPKAYGGGKPKFSLGMLIKKSGKKDMPELEDFRRAISVALNARWPDSATRPKKLVSPIKDGDTDTMEDGTLRRERYPEISGHWLISSMSAFRPGLVDAALQPIINKEEFYSGCYARAQLVAFAYAPSKDRPQSKCGIGFGLQNIQKLRDGEPLGGRQRAEAAFEPVKTAAETPEDISNDPETMFSGM